MTVSAKRPVILTSGDPAGVGPELTVLAAQQLSESHPFLVLGDTQQYTRLCAKAGIDCHVVEDAKAWRPGGLCVIPQQFPCHIEPGEAALENAPAIIEMIERAVALTKAGTCAAVVTNPINKDVLIRGAGFNHPGHTEFLAELDNKQQSVMMLASPDLRVVPATIHIPILDVPSTLTKALLCDTINCVHTALIRDFGIKSPRIAVAGLNPHAGENGQMGREDIDIIAPVLNELRQTGMEIVGPMSADTMFHARARQAYDAAICMYHDQALIPIKTLDFDRGVNVTLGLSFIRTSPDHGTAFDIAGQGIANPQSLIEAIKLAGAMALHRASA